MENKKFMFYENFWNAIEQLPEEQKAIACYEFCKYGITGQLPDNPMFKMFCIGVSASVQKYQGRGGSRVGAGRPKKQLNQEDNENQKIQKNQNNQKIHNTQTETINININKNINYKFIGDVIKLNEKDYNSWKNKFPLLDLDFELKKRDIWLANCDSPPKNWFISTAQYLLTENDKKQKEKDKRLKKWEDF
jgi:hypothetical protein